MIQVNARGMLAITPTITAITPKNTAKLDGHLDGLYLRNHDFSGETKNWLEP